MKSRTENGSPPPLGTTPRQASAGGNPLMTRTARIDPANPIRAKA
jgi:hypothetical protein